MSDERARLDERLREDDANVASLLGHLYRGEMDRETTWRGRLDQTTNWAVTVMAAIVTWAFSSGDNPHYLLLIGIGTVAIFHAVETHRYRVYDVFRSRIRLLEEDVFAPLIARDVEAEHDEWRTELAEDLRRPALKIPLGEAFARRLRRIYLPLLYVLLAAWIVRITAFSSDPPLQAAGAENVPGWVVVAVVGAFYVTWTAIALWPRERQAMGELYDRQKEGAWKED